MSTPARIDALQRGFYNAGMNEDRIPTATECGIALDYLDSTVDHDSPTYKVAWRIAVALGKVSHLEHLEPGWDLEELWAEFSSRVGIERLKTDQSARRIRALPAVITSNVGALVYREDAAKIAEEKV